MSIPRTARELVRFAVDLAVGGVLLSGLMAVAARFFIASTGAHEVFVIGLSATALGCVVLVVLAVVVKTIEVGNRPDA
jgi:hypothetical protein